MTTTLAVLLAVALLLLYRQQRLSAKLQDQIMQALRQLPEINERTFSALTADLQRIAEQLVATSDRAPATSTSSSRLRSKALRLAASGMGAGEIANELNISRGEAELIVKLNACTSANGKGAKNR